MRQTASGSDCSSCAHRRSDRGCVEPRTPARWRVPTATLHVPSPVALCCTAPHESLSLDTPTHPATDAIRDRLRLLRCKKESSDSDRCRVVPTVRVPLTSLHDGACGGTGEARGERQEAAQATPSSSPPQRRRLTREMRTEQQQHTRQHNNTAHDEREAQRKRETTGCAHHRRVDMHERRRQRIV